VRYYIGLIHKEADSDYGVSFPDFPGVATAGTSLDDAQTMAEEALAFHVDGLVEDGEALPERPASMLLWSCLTIRAALLFVLP